MCSVCAFIVVS